MLSVILFSLGAASFLTALIRGEGEALLSATLAGSEKTVKLGLTLLGITAFWSGLFRVADRAGITCALAKLLRPITRLLFPGLRDPQALSHVTTNMVANVIGIGNAATPAGLLAVKRMQAINGDGISREISAFCVLNCASIQVIPTTILSLRAAAGSGSPAAVLPCVWIASLGAACVGLCLVRVLSR